MADEEASNTESQSAVDAAMAGIPGLRESMQGSPQPAAAQNDPGEGGEDGSFAGKRAQVEDSDAVTEALNQIPGLRDSMGR